jgi:hypothetical protein
MNFVNIRSRAPEHSEKIAKRLSSSAKRARSARPTTADGVSIDEQPHATMPGAWWNGC